MMYSRTSFTDRITEYQTHHSSICSEQESVNKTSCINCEADNWRPLKLKSFNNKKNLCFKNCGLSHLTEFFTQGAMVMFIDCNVRKRTLT